MHVHSLTFGTIEIDENTVYTFPRGIPGLGKIQRFALVELDQPGPYRWLQACDPPQLTLVLLEPAALVPDYRVEVAAEHRGLLELDSGDNGYPLVIVAVPQDPRQMTANLLAPLILNPARRKGVQAIVNGPAEWLRVRVLQES